MARWVVSLSEDHWLNIDRLDGLDIQHTSGDRWMVVAERRGLPNTILGTFESKATAQERVARLIGVPDGDQQEQ